MLYKRINQIAVILSTIFIGVIVVQIVILKQTAMPNMANAAGEQLTINAPMQFGPGYSLNVDSYVDRANTAFYMTPAATGTSLSLAGDASSAGSLYLGNTKSIRSAYGPLKLDYKSALNAWTTGLSLEDTTGNIVINGNSFTVRVVSATELGVYDSTGTQLIGFDEGS